jgi:WD40 repeat protein
MPQPDPFRPRLVVSDAATGKIQTQRDHMPDTATDVAVPPAGDRIAVRCGRFISVWDADLRNLQGMIAHPVRRLHFTGLAFHPSGQYLATTSNDALVRVYDPATRQLRQTLTWAIGKLKCVAFSPDGSLAAAGGDGGRVVVWDFDG